MKKLFATFFLFVIVLCANADSGRIKIIPEPVSIEEQPGSFKLDKEVVLLMPKDEELINTVQLFTKQIATSTGIELKIIDTAGKGDARKIFSISRDNSDEHKESYSLDVSPSIISLKTQDNAGIFYSLQTLMQLLPAEDMREMIQYAPQRYVTILPEFDVPAHSLLLIASYPNLSCTQLQYHLDAGAPFWEKEDNVLGGE